MVENYKPKNKLGGVDGEFVNKNMPNDVHRLMHKKSHFSLDICLSIRYNYII